MALFTFPKSTFLILGDILGTGSQRRKTRDGQFATRQFRSHPAAVEYEGPARNARDFLEIGGNENDGQASIERLLKKSVDLRFCPYVNSECRLLEYQEPAVRLQPSGHDDLLLISAGQGGNLPI